MEEALTSGSVTRYGVYKTELALLSKSNQSRLCRFILDFGIKRKDDSLRQQALKFIECLRCLPEYEPLIEEGSEEALINGDEEVKFIKKDIQTATATLKGMAQYLPELIKFTITNNQKQLEKLLPEASLAQDVHTLHLLLLNTRGLAVKAYDHSRDNILLSTREWTPLHYAVFF